VNAVGSPAARAASAARPCLQERQPPVRGPADQHVRRPGRGLPLLLLRVLLLLFSPRVRRSSRRGGRRAGLVQQVHRGLVGGQHVLGGQRREHRRIEPAGLQLRAHPRRGLIDPAGRDLRTQEHADEPRGTLRRHVPATDVPRDHNSGASRQDQVGARKPSTRTVCSRMVLPARSMAKLHLPRSAAAGITRTLQAGRRRPVRLEIQAEPGRPGPVGYGRRRGGP
jgi:hypothetical protein